MGILFAVKLNLCLNTCHDFLIVIYEDAICQYCRYFTVVQKKIRKFHFSAKDFLFRYVLLYESSKNVSENIFPGIKTSKKKK